MWKRIRRVLYPYIVWTAIYSIPNSHRFLINLLTASSAAQMYYVLVYIQLVLLTTLCLKILKRRNGALLMMLISPSSFLIKYLQTFGGLSLPGFINTIYGISFLPWIWYYVLGMKMGQMPEKKSKLRSSHILLFTSIGLQMLEGYIWYRAGDPNCGTQMKITSLTTSTLACLLWRKIIIHDYNSELKDKKLHHFLIVVGDYSFGIYLSHIAIMMVFNKLPGYSYVPYVCNSFLVLLASLACCIIGSVLLSKVKYGKMNLSQLVGLS